jgi:hypothetical protein
MNRSTLKKAVLFVCMLFLIVFGIRAANPVDLSKPGNIISFNMTTPFDPNFPRLRFGYTFIYSPNWSQSIEIGYGRRFMFPDSTFYSNQNLSRSYRIWEIRMESRYYMAGIREHVIPFTGLEIYHIRHRQILYDNSFERASDGLDVDYTQANYRRIKAGFNIKAGVIFRLNPVLALELYAGIGPRYKENRYTNVIEGGTGGDDNWFEDWNYYHKEGIHWSMNFTGGFKLDFMF